MATNVIKNVGQMVLEPLFSSGVITAVVENGIVNPPEDLVRNLLPISGTFATVNTGLALALHVHEKPKIVQIAFPFFSGLAAAALLPAIGLPTTELLGTYLFCSGLLSGIALVKVIAKAIFAKQAEPKEESKPHRVFNYVVPGAVTFIPSVIVGSASTKLFGSGEWVLGLMGVFFGLAQVCVTTLLGATQESRMVHGFLPMITSVLPSLIFGAMETMRSPDLPALILIPATALATALIGTVATRYMASQPSAPAQIETNSTQDAKPPVDHRSTYRRWGSTVLPQHSPDAKKYI